MSVKGFGAALAVLLGLGMGPTQAQSLREVTAPVNPPPASFKGQQFIDARGCVFVRAGFGGAVNWVPRIDGSKKPICGMLPSGADAAPDVAAVETPAAPRPAKGGFWAALFAPQPAPQPAPQAAPPAQDLILTVTPAEPARVLPTPPKGWKYAWKDDRLNPMRAIGTAEGQAAQNRVYTQAVPMVALVDLPAAKRPKVTSAKAPGTPAALAPVTVSTMSAPQTGVMVQVGAFGDPLNAQRAGERIAGLGLHSTKAGHKGLTVVFAGPFASASDAAEGLRSLRAAGFADAFLR